MNALPQRPIGRRVASPTTVSRGIEQGKLAENINLEVKALKLIFDISNEQCAQTILDSLLMCRPVIVDVENAFIVALLQGFIELNSLILEFYRDLGMKI